VRTGSDLAVSIKRALTPFSRPARTARWSGRRPAHSTVERFSTPRERAPRRRRRVAGRRHVARESVVLPARPHAGRPPCCRRGSARCRATGYGEPGREKGRRKQLHLDRLRPFWTPSRRDPHHPSRRFHSSQGIAGSRRGNARRRSRSSGSPKPNSAWTSVKHARGALGMRRHS
jgi:hypothetical protein